MLNVRTGSVRECYSQRRWVVNDQEAGTEGEQRHILDWAFCNHLSRSGFLYGLPVGVAEPLLVELAGRVSGQFFHEINRTRGFDAAQVFLAIRDQFGSQGLGVG